MKNAPFLLVPLSGDQPSDVLQNFDGHSKSILNDPQACQGALRSGIRPFINNPSPYEAQMPAESTGLALEAAAREGQRLGLSEVAQALTEPSVRHRQALEAHLADTLAPAGPEPAQPGLRPSGLRVGMGMAPRA